MKKVLKQINVTIVAVILAAMLGNSTACPPGEVPQCPFPDPEYSVFFPHPNDCGWFFHCSNGVAFCKPCPGDLLFNVDLETCDYEPGILSSCSRIKYEYRPVNCIKQWSGYVGVDGCIRIGVLVFCGYNAGVHIKIDHPSGETGKKEECAGSIHGTYLDCKGIQKDCV